MFARGLFFVLSLLSLVARAAETKRAPHIVIFLADDMSWADVPLNHPQSGIRMPNVERLARAGMTFSHAFVASPSCAPSRAALLTGLVPPRNGAMFNHSAPDAAIKKWPAYFREAGYEVVSFGKTGHGATVRDYGFDLASHIGQPFSERIPAAVDWLEKRPAGRPLCLLVGTNWPHTPWPDHSDYQPGKVSLPPNQIDTPETRIARTRYAQAVSEADREMGLLYDAARRALGEDTLFIFTSDHGSAFPFGKWNLYDDSLRVPLVIAWPGKIAADAKSGAMVSWLDLLPTLLEAAGAKPPPVGNAPGQIDGRSFFTVLRGEARTHRDFIYATHSGDGTMNEYPIRAIRTRDWIYVRNLTPGAEHHTHIDKATNEHAGAYWPSWTEKAKSEPVAAATVSHYHHRPAEELYDLRHDPWELKNLAFDPAQADRLRDLREQLDASMLAAGDEGLATEKSRRPPAKKKSPD